MIVKRLIEPTETEVERIVDITVRSFSGNVAEKAFLGGDWSLHPEYCRAQTRAVALEGELYVGIDEPTGEIVSTAFWFPPGTSLFGSEAQRALGYNEFSSKLKCGTKKWEKEVFGKIVSEKVTPLFEKQELLRRWWCCNLATHPDYRQHGFGTALMEVLAEKVADKLGHILGLIATTVENTQFYRSIGYIERGYARVPAPTGDFDMYVMSRDAPRKSRD